MQNNSPTPVPQHIFHPNLNLPSPPSFSGSPLHLPTFKMKLVHFQVGNRNTYIASESQILYAGQLQKGLAYQWYQSIVDPNIIQLPPSYDLACFLQELEDFSGGAVTLHSRERSLDMLCRTGSISDLAVAFENITHTFHPRWPDHPLIYLFSRKLKETDYKVRAHRSRFPPPHLSCLPCDSHLRRTEPGCCSPLPLPTLLSATPQC